MTIKGHYIDVLVRKVKIVDALSNSSGAGAK